MLKIKSVKRCWKSREFMGRGRRVGLGDVIWWLKSVKDKKCWKSREFMGRKKGWVRRRYLAVRRNFCHHTNTRRALAALLRALVSNIKV